MKQLFKPSSLLLYMLVVPVFFFVGMYLVALSGTAEGQGLAGGAIVLFYGIVSAALALLVSFIIAYQANHVWIVRINKILALVLVIFLATFAYQIFTRENDSTPPPTQSPITQPVVN